MSNILRMSLLLATKSLFQKMLPRSGMEAPGLSAVIWLIRTVQHIMKNLYCFPMNGANP